MQQACCLQANLIIREAQPLVSSEKVGEIKAGEQVESSWQISHLLSQPYALRLLYYAAEIKPDY